MNNILRLRIIYNMFILAGTSYIVFGLEYSGWWFLVAMLFMNNFGKYEEIIKDIKEKNYENQRKNNL